MFTLYISDYFLIQQESLTNHIRLIMFWLKKQIVTTKEKQGGNLPS